MVSVVMPIYLPTPAHRVMTDKNLYLAKKFAGDVQWVIVETCSDYYVDEAEIYINEKVKTTPNRSINRALKCADGEFVVFLANDVTVCDGFIEKMKKCFDVKSDCGLASLGNNEHRDFERDEIVEDLFFSVCMLRKEDAWLDQAYSYIFDDTDLIFRLHLKGLKTYKNLNGIVQHKPHSTYGKYCGDQEEYERSREYFKKKYASHSGDALYRTLIGPNG